MLQKVFFKVVGAIHILLYRLSGGRLGGKMGEMNLLLLTTTGRKSGKLYMNPLGYVRDGDSYVVMASAGGAPNHPSWFYNLKSNPQTTIQVKKDLINVVAEQAVSSEYERLIAQLGSLQPLFKNYQQKVSRQIPIMVFRPVVGDSG